MMLVSDFHDYYDPWFSRTGPTFRRITTEGPSKREQFAILDAAGFRTPPHGLVGEIMGQWWESEQRWIRRVVAYTDERSHCGDGKVVYREGQLQSNPHMGMPGGDRFWRERQLYCSAFVGDQLVERPGVSWRLLNIGERRFWLEYRSADDWRSNCGDVEIEVIGEGDAGGKFPTLPYPLYAVDFVIGRELYAVDLNTAPGVRGSGVERLLPGREAVDLIGRAFALATA